MMNGLKIIEGSERGKNAYHSERHGLIVGECKKFF